MRGPHLRITIKSVVAIVCAACFLTTSFGSASRAVAADTWETQSGEAAEPGIEKKPATDASEAAKDWERWPKKKAEPGIEQKPATEANGAAKAGDAAGKNAATERSYGTIGWIALGIAVVIGIAIAAGGGGGGGDGGVVTNPGHH